MRIGKVAQTLKLSILLLSAVASLSTYAAYVATIVPPKITTPSANAALTASTTSVSLSWNAAPGAEFYLVRMNEYHDAARTLVSKRTPFVLNTKANHYVYIDRYKSLSVPNVPVTVGKFYSFWIHSAKANGSGFDHGPESEVNFSVSPLAPVVSLAPPVITAPLANASLASTTTSLNFSWNAVSDAEFYLIRMEEYHDAAKTLVSKRTPFVLNTKALHYVYIDSYKGLSLSNVPVTAGKFYSFWIHSAKMSGTKVINGKEAVLDFSVKAPIVLASCDGVASGGTQSRTMFQESSVPHGSVCVSQPQTRTCNNGTWSAYSGTYANPLCVVQSPPPPAPTPVIVTNFKVGDKIETVVRKRVRSIPQITATSLLGEQLAGAVGTLIAGPTQTNDSYGIITWWKIDFESGHDGFVGEDDLKLYGAPLPNPLPLDPGPVPPPVVTDSGCENGRTTAIKQSGITWFFDKEYSCGQYANGDHWVVGPLTIKSITPLSGVRKESLNNGTTIDRIVNGTMVNPALSYGTDTTTPNGFDNAVSKTGVYNGYAPYSDSANVAPSRAGKALFCPAGTSVVSSISTVGLPSSSSYSQVDTIAILTVVASAPSVGSFRPPATGTDKSHRWNKSQLNYSILKKLSPAASAPTLSEVEAKFASSWTTFHVGNAIQSMTPIGTMPNYGRNQAYDISDALFTLNLNYTNAQKEKLYVALVQYGIDIYGYLRDGGFYRGAGGLNLGHKAPLVLAALSLNDPLMKAWASKEKRVRYPTGKYVAPFLEDDQLWVVTADDVGRALYTADGRPREQYTQSHVGLPEWGEQHNLDSNRDGSNWNAFYRDIAGSANVGNALGIRMLTGGEEMWDNPIFFDYCDRYWRIEGSGGFADQNFSANKIKLFHFDMLKMYNNSF